MDILNFVKKNFVFIILGLIVLYFYYFFNKKSKKSRKSEYFMTPSPNTNTNNNYLQFKNGKYLTLESPNISQTFLGISDVKKSNFYTLDDPKDKTQRLFIFTPQKYVMTFASFNKNDINYIYVSEQTYDKIGDYDDFVIKRKSYRTIFLTPASTNEDDILFAKCNKYYVTFVTTENGIKKVYYLRNISNKSLPENVSNLISWTDNINEADWVKLID
jgi:hypothetical protein